MLLARWFLGSLATDLAGFPPELRAELHPDLAKIGLLGTLEVSLPLDSLLYWPSRAASQGRPSFPARFCHVNGRLSLSSWGS